jgi:hypothetical protein
MTSTLEQHVKILGNPGLIARSNTKPEVRGEGRYQTFLAELCDTARDMWIVGNGAETFTAAAQQVGIEPLVTMQFNESEYWRAETNTCNLRGMVRKLTYDETKGTEWIICPSMNDYKETDKRTTFEHTMSKLITRGARAMIMIWPGDHAEEQTNITEEWKTHK